MALRPEVITDVLLEHLGIDAARPLLRVLRGRPNAWHGLLGAALGADCCVLTTNFDTLIEQACDALGAGYRTVVGTAVEGGVAAKSVAVPYALVEARAFELATQVFQHTTKARPSSRILIARAVVLEKYGTDLRPAATVARKARTISKNEPADIRALVLDQSGVIARRRGLHRLALRFYDQALKIARPSNSPEWLLMQIRSHRAVALEYLDRRTDALREHRRVANYEQRTGDLLGYAKSLNNIGIVHMNQHQWKSAIAALEQSCALERDLGDRRGVAQSLHNLGKLHFLRQDYPSPRARSSKASASASAAPVTITASPSPTSPSPTWH